MDAHTGGISDGVDCARRFLGGEDLAFTEADGLWRKLKESNELALARMALQRIRLIRDRIEGFPANPAVADELCREEALLTSKDIELNAAVRHDLALKLLADRYDLASPKLDGDSEILGIAGGICKRRWGELGQFADLKRAAEFYERGAKGGLGTDAYAQINAAFLDDVLAAIGDDPGVGHGRAKALRERIVNELNPIDEAGGRPR